MRIIRRFRYFLFSQMETARIHQTMLEKFDVDIETARRELIKDLTVPDDLIDVVFLERMHAVRVEINRRTHRRLLALARIVKRKVEQ